MVLFEQERLRRVASRQNGRLWSSQEALKPPILVYGAAPQTPGRRLRCGCGVFAER
ncbi:unnamed protein product [Staurois parvus]|uniref:Uncharacterized protein n=1 Tax=Staurois parvus TaxID=386267 RepID=A0ABN9BZS7_9NEOB|nr:unnamed protein product [Staurois parvus]